MTLMSLKSLYRHIQRKPLSYYDVTREVFSNYEVEVKSVKFFILPNRKLNKYRRFAEVEVFSQMAAAEMVDNLDGEMEFGVKLRVRQKYVYETFRSSTGERCITCRNLREGTGHKVKSR